MPTDTPRPRSPLSNAMAGYWRQSQRPLASLAFILPLLVLYEAGVLLFDAATVRNGADLWLRLWLERLGFGQYFLLPLLTIGLLLAWHHTTHQRWQLSAVVMYAMYLECALLGLALLAVGLLEGSLLQQIAAHGEPPVCAAIGFDWRQKWLAHVIGFLGAGIYEEVLFRLMLLPAVAGVLTFLGAGSQLRVVGAIVATSLAFSAAHYVGPSGETFEAFGFAFRCLAGGFFATLFIARGFGIAAGTHALYDVFVGLW
jgi:membrane protease YdiL (CAAX protease family)